MGARRIDMHRLQEVIRLHRLGRSRRAIARQLRIGRNTVRGYLEAVSKAGILDGPAEDLPELDHLRAIVEEHVPSAQAPQQVSTVEMWRDEIVRLRGEQEAGPTAIVTVHGVRVPNAGAIHRISHWNDCRAASRHQNWTNGA